MASRLSHTRKPPRRRTASPGSVRNAGGRSSRAKPSGHGGASYRTIVAKYPGKCRRCGGAITPGEPIRWAPGRGSWHMSDRCGVDDEAAEARIDAGDAAPTDDELEESYRQRWAPTVTVDTAAGAELETMGEPF